MCRVTHTSDCDDYLGDPVQNFHRQMKLICISVLLCSPCNFLNGACNLYCTLIPSIHRSFIAPFQYFFSCALVDRPLHVYISLDVIYLINGYDHLYIFQLSTYWGYNNSINAHNKNCFHCVASTSNDLTLDSITQTYYPVQVMVLWNNY